MKAAPIHLHWAHHRPLLLRDTICGFALCGARAVPRAQLTAFADDATCSACLGRVVSGVNAEEAHAEHKSASHEQQPSK